MKRIVLASASPRRTELLRTMGLEFSVQPSSFDEKTVTAWPPEDHVIQSALGKASDIAGRIGECAIVIGADTIVVADDRILGKPESVEDAAAMLKLLSGRAHFVYTGICVFENCPADMSQHVQTAYVRTKVTFGILDETLISAYVATGEPMDKAGAYGIQGRGSVLVESIDGDYFNVVGLPVYPLSRMLAELGIPIIGGTP